jgi:hypothetical protein
VLDFLCRVLGLVSCERGAIQQGGLCLSTDPEKKQGGEDSQPTPPCQLPADGQA